MDDLLREFVGETLDMMDAVAGDLVAWEADPTDRSGLDRIFRTVHTVKGSSGFFEIPRITAIAHAAEELLDVLRSRRGAPTRASVAMVLAAFDRIRELTQAIAGAGVEPVGDDSRLIAAMLVDIRIDDRSAVAADVPVDLDLTLVDPVLDAGVEGPHDLGGDVPAAWRSVRVPVDLLDELMSGVSDLVLARNEVAAQLRGRGIDLVELAAFERLSQLLVSVRASVSHMRMVPLRHLYAPLPRLVRQVADELGKEVQLTLDGSEVEIDREVIESLRDPMLHLLRNAIDHGMESASERQAAGKSAVGRVGVSARQAGNRILISISDDGAGLSLAGLVERAIGAGHLTAAQAAALSDARKAELVFLPGLSTAAQVTGISGRGVGMDVVKANVERLGGTIQIVNRPGQGVTLTLDVPMTLTIIAALAIEAGGQSFAIPRSAIDEVMLASSDTVQRMVAGGAGMIRVRGRVLPLLQIEAILGLPPANGAGDDDRAIVLCRIGNGQSLALEVPDVRDHEELVIKPLPPVLLALGLYSGLSLPDNGQPMLVLDVEAIAQRMVVQSGAALLHDADEASDVAADDDRSLWLSFSSYGDGRQQAVAMATVERIADFDAANINQSGGRIIVQVDGSMLPVVATGFEPPTSGKVRMIRLGDGCRTVLLPVAAIGQMMDLAPDMLPSASDSGLVGMAMTEDGIIELLDSYALLAGFGHDSGGAAALRAAAIAGVGDDGSPTRPLWIVDPAGGEWAAGFLVPSLTAAGYQVTIVSRRDAVSGAHPTVISMAAPGPVSPIKVESGGKVHSLSAYDRSALLDLILGEPAGERRKPGRKPKGAAA